MRAARSQSSLMETVLLRPGHTSLADWRAVHAGAPIRLDPACMPAVEKSARAIQAILARPDPVYGINTGFGRLAEHPHRRR